LKLRFGPFVLDSDARQLLADGEPRRLTPKALALIELLVEQRPRAVSKQEILERLWPATFVSDSNVASLVNEVREALGDDRRRPRYLRTVHRFGYAFCATAAPVDRAAGGAVFRVIADHVDFPLQPGENVLGRAADAAVPIDHSSVSRRHAVADRGGAGHARGLPSKNGTFVQGQRVTHPLPLADCDEILLGRVRLLFRITSGETSTTTVWPSES
jgi:DNA-binding winged helix-turn-helix (wHTH) protein